MADRYDLRSQQPQDDSSYANLPGTSSIGDFVHHHVTELKSRAITGRETPGCQPSRWIHELLNNSFTTCDIFDRARHAQLDTPFEWQHEHRLVLNGNQSHGSNSSNVLSSLCLDCHFHFVFKIEWEEQHAGDCCNARQATWPMRDSLFPWHHLVWAGSEPDHMLEKYRTKYNPLLAREYFVCTAPPCTFKITLDVLEPRMGKWWVKLLLDKEAILQELQKARELEPHRYEGASESWAAEAPLNLNTYLKNLIESDPDKLRRVAKRNKRFSVIFGARCAEIFRQLEFVDEPSINEKGIDEGALIPKAPEPLSTPTSTTEPGTYRAYIEDVRAEVQCLIHKAGQNQDTAERPSFIISALHQDLGCQQVANLDGNLVNIQRYKLLGVLPDQPKEVVVNAYIRQWELLASKRRELIEALVGVANDLGDDQLSAFAMTQSSVFESQLERHNTSDEEGLTNQALIYLGLSPPNTYNAETILKSFRNKVVQEPGDMSTAQNMLMLVAQASLNPEYQSSFLTEATGLSFETSKAVLGFTASGSTWQNCHYKGTKKIQASKSKDETLLYLSAMDCIADHMDSAPLKAATSELREKHSNTSVSFHDETSQPGNIALPVGLNNIGNTCYLNSLLQYLYTVKAVRDIVLNYDDYRLELKDEMIQERRLGGNKMQMDRGEAVVAQAFVRELADLFENLHKSDKVATRPSQRLANAVLLSTHSIIEDAKTAAAEAAATKAAPRPQSPPPLPTRPSASPPPPFTDSGRNLAKEHVIEMSDSSSTGSSITLVDTPDVVMGTGAERVSNTNVQSSFEDISTTGITTIDPSPTHASEAKLADVDVIMVDEEAPQSIDTKVLSALEHQKRSSGTDQQDVEEVIGSIINRLQAAIQPSLVDEETGIQLEKIMETFFVTTVNYTKKFDERTYQSEIGFDRSITAFPAPDGPCTLYDALGRNFDQQVLEDSKLSRYTAIKQLPPILHVLIQRSQSIGRKNNNPVIIPETLYLDRYMDAPHESSDFKRRIAQWAVGSRLADLQQDQSKLKPPTRAPLQPTAPADETLVEDAKGFDPSFDIDGPIDVDFPGAGQVTSETVNEPNLPAGSNPLNSQPQLESQIWDMMQQELAQRDQELNTELEGLTKHPYRLQAVICHRGHLSSGHYWVWIHDFEENMWRNYNDADVKENPDTEEVLKQLSDSGEPYYLCYVRDGDKNDHVNVPKRQPAVPDLVQVDSDGDVPIRNSSSSLSDGSGPKVLDMAQQAEPQTLI